MYFSTQTHLKRTSYSNKNITAKIQKLKAAKQSNNENTYEQETKNFQSSPNPKKTMYQQCRIIWAILEWQKMQRNILQQQSWEHCEFCRFRRSQKRIMSSCFLKCSKSEDNEATISRWLFKRDVTKNKRRHCRAKYDAITNNNFCENIKDRPKSRPGTRKRWHQHHEDAFLYDLFEVIFFVISHG